jgi:Amt family ammonium transporter
MSLTIDKKGARPLLGLLMWAMPVLAMAADAPKLDSGDTAWMLTSMALVLMMTVPGLALFYAGMVRAKNALSVMMQCFAITCLVTVLWALYAYSLAFYGGVDATAPLSNLHNWMGDLSHAFMSGVTLDPKAPSVYAGAPTIPETVYSMFQLTFAIITPALIVGAFAERMKFSAMLWFMGLWLTLVYAPIAHWVWGGGWAANLGVKDFAGGTVVHINAGIAGLVAALVLGKRKGYPGTPMPPHNLLFTVTGASLLWVGWFGFNAGSAVAANGTAGMAMAVTQIATAAAALAWMFSEWISHGKPSALGIASGAVAGLVAITPASGFVGPMGAIAIGAAAGVGCYIASAKVKRVLGYDDSLDAFGVHAIGGIIGALLTGVFIDAALGGAGLDKDVTMAAQVTKQAIGVMSTIVYDGVVSFVILKVLDILIGLRVTEEQETEGLDVALHDERGYVL